MTTDALIDQLESQGPALWSLFAGETSESVRFRPAPGKWSMIEVLCHLLDEERLDFRKRIELTLADPNGDWPGIDPEGWVISGGYYARKLGGTLAAHRLERIQSVTWLRGLVAPEWSRPHQHPKAGPLSAGDLLAAWVAHDLLHLRQLANIRLARLQSDAAPFSIRYASA